MVEQTRGIPLAWADNWTSDDGLAFSRADNGWRVEIVRELPQRLGDPCAVELPREGGIIASGEMLMAMELSKARIEFTAPCDVIVCESRNLSAGSPQNPSGQVAWSLVIEPRNI